MRIFRWYFEHDEIPDDAVFVRYVRVLGESYGTYVTKYLFLVKKEVQDEAQAADVL